MSKHKSETQTITLLKEQEAGIGVSDICRKHGIGQSTFYKWCSKYGGMAASDARRLKELETENRRLKQMYAALSLLNKMQEDIIKKL